MANSNLTLSIVAVDKASKTLGNIGKSISDMSLKTVVTGAALLSFGATSMKAFSDSEQAQLKLNDAFAKFPKLSDTNTGSLNRLNSEMQKKTRFDDEAYASAEAQLAQYDLTGQQIKQLTPLVADLAAKTGVDLQTASEQVGKALLGQGRALKVVGINFVNTGTTAGNLTELMSGLRTQVGGFAEKEGTTAAGKIAILKNQFNDLQEQIGSILVPVLGLLVSAITPVLDAFNALPGPVKSGVLTVGLLGGAFYLLLPKITAAKAAFLAFRSDLALTIAMTNAFNVSLAVAFAPLAALVAAIVATTVVLVGINMEMSQNAKVVSNSVAAWDAFYKAASPSKAQDLDNSLRQSLVTLDQWNTSSNDAGLLMDKWRLGVDAMGSILHNHKSVVEQAYVETVRLGNAQRDIGLVIGSVATQTGMTTDKVKSLADIYKIDLTQGVDAATKSLKDKILALDQDQLSSVQAAIANGDLKTSEDLVKEASQKVTDKINSYKTALDKLNGSTLDVQSAQDNATKAFQTASTAIDANDGKITGNTAKSLEARGAIRDFIKAKQDEAGAVVTSTGSIKDGNKVLGDAASADKELGKKYKIPQSALDTYLNSLKTIPSKKSTTVKFKVDTSGWTQTERDLLAVYMELPKSTQIGIALGVPVAGARAAGGPVRSGMPYIVGENQPELFVPSTNGVIVPSVPTGGGSAGTHIHINPQVMPGTEDVMARAIVKSLNDYQRRGGRLQFTGA